MPKDTKESLQRQIDTLRDMEEMHLSHIEQMDQLIKMEDVLWLVAGLEHGVPKINHIRALARAALRRSA